jgi:RimJ/RimL family protein N-acetyltransferase
VTGATALGPDRAPAAVAPPVIETARLILREFTADDAPAVASIFQDDAARVFYPDMHRLSNAERWVRRNMDRYGEDGFGLWAIVWKETGEFAGDCGLLRQQIESAEEIEVGYHVHAMFRSRGIATEAARACVRWAFDRLDCPRIVSMVHPENHASRTVASRVHPSSRRFWRHGAHYFLYFTDAPGR